MPTALDPVPVLIGAFLSMVILGAVGVSVWALLTARRADERASAAVAEASRRADQSESVLKARLAEIEAKHEAERKVLTTEMARCMTVVAQIGDLVAQENPKARLAVDSVKMVARRSPLDSRPPAIMKTGAKIQLSDAELWALQCRDRGWKDVDGLDLVGEDADDAKAMAEAADKVLKEARV